MEFKIKLISKTKEKDWKVTYVNAGRKEKTCSVCNQRIKIGQSAVTFTKQTKVGANTKFETYYTCPIYSHQLNNCAKEQAKKLGVTLP